MPKLISTVHAIELPEGLPSDPRQQTREQYRLTVDYLMEESTQELHGRIDAHRDHIAHLNRQLDAATDPERISSLEGLLAMESARQEQVSDAILIKIGG